MAVSCQDNCELCAIVEDSCDECASAVCMDDDSEEVDEDTDCGDCPCDYTMVLQTTNGGILCMYYDSLAPIERQVKYFAVVRSGTYLGFGYGTDMINTHMIGFYAGSGPDDSRCQDLYSSAFEQPSVSTDGEYTQGTITPLGLEVELYCDGPLEPANGFQIALGETIQSCWSYGDYADGDGSEGMV